VGGKWATGAPAIGRITVGRARKKTTVTGVTVESTGTWAGDGLSLVDAYWFHMYQTGCTFTAHPGQPMSGTMRLGQLGNKLSSGEDYRPEDVKAMMRQLWEKHCATNK
jgi:hypothetical protein